MSHPAHYHHEWPPNAKCCGTCGGHQITDDEFCDVFVRKCDDCGFVSRVSNDGLGDICTNCKKAEPNVRFEACGGKLVLLEPYPVRSTT